MKSAPASSSCTVRRRCASNDGKPPRGWMHGVPRCLAYATAGKRLSGTVARKSRASLPRSPRASGCDSTRARRSSIPGNRAAGSGLAIRKISHEVVDRDADVRLLVVHPIEAEALEQGLDLVLRPVADDHVAADVQQHALEPD